MESVEEFRGTGQLCVQQFDIARPDVSVTETRGQLGQDGSRKTVGRKRSERSAELAGQASEERDAVK